MNEEHYYMCPSAAFTPHSLMLGVLNTNGATDFLDGPVPLTEDMLQTLRHMHDPEKHFRFTARCHSRGCVQWSDGKCSAASALMRNVPEVRSPHFDDCGITSSCRWRAQEGEAVCGFCKYIVRDASV
ncbi:MAG: hypothetical protein P8Y51_00745 [Campylobacterales bacterium]|jgi:hypothetical protein